MKIVQKIIVLVLAAIVMSCVDRLNIAPQQSISQEQAVSSEANIKALLLGSYTTLSVTGNSFVMADLLGSTGQVSWTGTFVGPRQIFNKKILSYNGMIARNWRLNYKLINAVNLVLDNAYQVSAKDRNSLKGQAYFLRAYAYFDLVRNFAPSYSARTAHTDLGVPLRLKGIVDYTTDQSIARSTVSEVYEQIIEDLKAAVLALPEYNGVFADKYAAKGLLARVYLQKGDFVAAREQADAVIRYSGRQLLSDYSLVFNNDNNTNEDILSYQVTDQTGVNLLITYYASQKHGGRGGDIWINSSYYEGFDSNQDVRASFVTDEYDLIKDRGGLTAKFMSKYANITLIRLAEMYLIRAETNFRLGQSVGASPVSDINAIRNRAGAKTLKILSLATILRERQYELAFEGFLIHDLKRTHQSVGHLPWDADALVMPIPQSEIDTNKLMEQNKGY